MAFQVFDSCVRHGRQDKSIKKSCSIFIEDRRLYFQNKRVEIKDFSPKSELILSYQPFGIDMRGDQKITGMFY